MPKTLPGVVLLTLFISPLVAAAQTNGSEAEIAPITDYQSVRNEKAYRATRTTGEILIDGFVDEAAWEAADARNDFFQSEPRTGYPATERTEWRLLFDDTNIYVSVVCEQAGPIIVSELARDFSPGDGDLVALMFDTFDDDRNGFVFQTNPGGAKRDQQVTGVIRNANWDGVYDVHSRITETGWTAEFAIPLKTLRFKGTVGPQRWGFNLLRITRHKNEWAIWSPGPRPFGIFDAFIAGSLDGLEGFRQGRNLRIKPWTGASFRPDVAEDSVLKKNDPDVGVDLKYGVTSQLTLDLTVNTDFAQVEADEQQVNLTRFSLFFPEKREFFLENAGLFDIGNTGGGGGGGGGGGPRPGGGGGGRPVIPFFSRRIGLSPEGTPLPIVGGARLTGRIARGLDIGILNMQVGSQGDVPADNYSVVRLKKELLANSDIGTFMFNRDSATPNDWNRSGGADANFRFLGRRLSFNGFAMKTYTPGDDTNNMAASVGGSYQDPFYTFRSSFVTIEDDFDNDFGFTPRSSIRKTRTFAGVKPRPRSGRIREFFPQMEINYITDQNNRLLTRTYRFTINASTNDGDFFHFNRHLTFERLDAPSSIGGDVELPAGDYNFNHWNMGFSLSRGRPFYINGGLRTGDFWTGTRREIRTGGGWRQGFYFNTNVSWTRNKVELPEGAFTTDLIRLRLNFAFSPKMFLNGLIQYNTATESVSSNIRFRFLHHPLSDIFIVYNESRGTGINDALNRTISLKFTHLMHF